LIPEARLGISKTPISMSKKVFIIDIFHFHLNSNNVFEVFKDLPCAMLVFVKVLQSFFLSMYHVNNLKKKFIYLRCVNPCNYMDICIYIGSIVGKKT
jgi:hypothetical protein